MSDEELNKVIQRMRNEDSYKSLVEARTAVPKSKGSKYVDQFTNKLLDTLVNESGRRIGKMIVDSILGKESEKDKDKK